MFSFIRTFELSFEGTCARKNAKYICIFARLFVPLSPQMKLKSIILKILMPLVLGGAILYWMYRAEDWNTIRHVMTDEMDWTWMLLSFPFGILAQMFRGWRWRQTLEPVGEYPRSSVSIHAIFISYAVSLIIPRMGEFTRCVILKRYDNISFPKALGTVVTAAILILLHLLLRKLSIYNKVRATLKGIWQGVISLKDVRNIPLFVIFTLGIWLSYFLHYYLTFFCFDATSQLGLGCALVTFIVGSIAVIVPTPNGAGPWHFAVKTMLILYGVADDQALYFVLIVHTVQTMLVILLGVYAWAALSFTKRINPKTS